MHLENPIYMQRLNDDRESTTPEDQTEWDEGNGRPRGRTQWGDHGDLGLTGSEASPLSWGRGGGVWGQNPLDNQSSVAMSVEILQVTQNPTQMSRKGSSLLHVTQSTVDAAPVPSVAQGRAQMMPLTSLSLDSSLSSAALHLDFIAK